MDDTATQTDIVDALELESEDTTTSEANTLYSVESAIKLRNQRLAEIKEKQKQLNEMLKSYLENNDDYREAAKLAKEAASKKSAIKQRLLSQPESQDLPAKLLEVKEEKAELTESLSYYLAEYQRLSGTNEFEDENGDLKQIVFVAKLVKRSGGK